MPEHAHVTIDGTVADLFGHRFSIETRGGRILADLGPKGAEQVKLTVGDKVKLTGEQKPSEVKVFSLSVHGRDYTLPHKKSGGHEVDEETAVAAVKALGFEPIEKPERHPKHFDILARRGEECRRFHVDFDGSIRKTKSVKPHASAEGP